MNKKSRHRSSQGRSRDEIEKTILNLQQVKEETDGETVYLNNLVQAKKRVVVKLLNNEEIEGWIEYYDKHFIRLTRQGEPNMFVYKNQIKYIVEC